MNWKTEIIFTILIMSIAGSIITMVWGLYCMTIGKRFVASWNKKGIIFCAVFYAVPLTVFGSLGNFYSQVNVEAHIINLLSLSSESVDRIFSSGGTRIFPLQHMPGKEDENRRHGDFGWPLV